MISGKARLCINMLRMFIPDAGAVMGHQAHVSDGVSRARILLERGMF